MMSTAGIRHSGPLGRINGAQEKERFFDNPAMMMSLKILSEELQSLSIWVSILRNDTVQFEDADVEEKLNPTIRQITL